MKRNLIIGSLLLLMIWLITCGGIYYAATGYLAISETRQEIIRDEFFAIERGPEFVPVSAYSSTRIDHVSYSTAYRSDQESELILAHYDQELTSNGWVFQERTRFGMSGRYTGGFCIVYKKNEISAEILYIGEDVDTNWDYEVVVSWGDQSCPGEPPLPTTQTPSS